jgi:hypothetical protein
MTLLISAAKLGRRYLSTAARGFTASGHATAKCIDLEERFGAHNYAPLPVVLAKGEGTCRDVASRVGEINGLFVSSR